jgi:hypothetical protein
MLDWLLQGCLESAPVDPGVCFPGFSLCLRGTALPTLACPLLGVIISAVLLETLSAWW